MYQFLSECVAGFEKDRHAILLSFADTAQDLWDILQNACRIYWFNQGVSCLVLGCPTSPSDDLTEFKVFGEQHLHSSRLYAAF